MNLIDKNFIEFIKVIKSKSLEEIFNYIKNKYLSINYNIQMAIEDFFTKFNYWGELKKSENNFEELFNRAKSIKEHIDDYQWLYNNLVDYRSKKLLFAILNNWYNFDFNTLQNCIETNFPHYFDLDIISLSEDEIFVDVGAFTGDTTIDFLNYFGMNSYKKIYCYEITKDSLLCLKNNMRYFKNIIIRNKAVSNEEKTLYINKNSIDNSANFISTTGDESIQAVKLDNDIHDKITLIKMDIEGYEQKALQGVKKQIIKNKPKLLISVYHNHEDLWKIPRMIKEMNSNYKFYLRYYGNNIFPTEIVLIAI